MKTTMEDLRNAYIQALNAKAAYENKLYAAHDAGDPHGLAIHFAARRDEEAANAMRLAARIRLRSALEQS